MDLQSAPHRRYNRLTGEWVKISPHRAQRPWQGYREKRPVENRPAYDNTCYLCPGNQRAGGERNPQYQTTFAFQNDFSALLPEAEEGESSNGLLKVQGERGICRVLCFSPRHDLTIAQMSQKEAENVVALWRQEYEALGRLDFINHVQIFENKGEIMGCSNPHPHGQIWAENLIPDLPAKELAMQKSYFEKTGAPLLEDYARQELELAERIIFETQFFIVLTPFWAVWPFETMIIPKGRKQSLLDLNKAEQDDLALAVRRLTARYDNLFEISFPYSMGIHQLPTDGKLHAGLQMHLHFYPPLLRSASVKKFMVGYEMLAMPQRDISPEAAAAKLRQVNDTRFS